MQWVSSGIWTRVAVFISYDDNNYTTGTSYKCDETFEKSLILIIKDDSLKIPLFL